MGSLEEMVLKRLRDGDYKGDKKLSAVINGSIKNMMKAILAATNANQKLMKLSVLAFEKRYWQMKTIYPKCIRAENKLKLLKLKVWKIYKKSKDIYTNYRKLAMIEGKKCVN